MSARYYVPSTGQVVERADTHSCVHCYGRGRWQGETCPDCCGSGRLLGADRYVWPVAVREVTGPEVGHAGGHETTAGPPASSGPAPLSPRDHDR